MENNPPRRPRKPACAIVIEGTQLFLRVGKTRYRLTGGLTEAELKRESARLARNLGILTERPPSAS